MDINKYNIVNRTSDEIELFDKEKTCINFVVCSNIIDAEGMTLNEYFSADEKIKKFSPEISVKSRIDGVEEKVQKGKIRIEVYDITGGLVGERDTHISELGHVVKPGYGFVPYVMIPDGVSIEDINEIRVSISVEE